MVTVMEQKLETYCNSLNILFKNNTKENSLENKDKSVKAGDDIK